MLAVLCCAVGCGRKGKVIPRAKMAEIYADMFIADQWIRDNPDCRKEADTTLFFEAIFQKYGYTKKDYEASVAEYVKDPTKFAKIFNKAVDIMNKQRDATLAIPDSLQHRTDGPARDPLHKFD